MAHTYIGEEVLIKFIDDLKEYGIAEGRPNMEGRTLNVIVSPISKKKS